MNFRGISITLLIFLFYTSASIGESIHVTSAKILTLPGNNYENPPYEVDDRTLLGKWENVSLPHLLARPVMVINGSFKQDTISTLVTWYHLSLPATTATQSTRYLYIPRWKTDGRIAVYGNGRMLYQSHSNINWNGWNIPLWIPLDVTANTPPPNTILLRIEHPIDRGGGISSMWAGEEKGLSWRYQLRYFLQVELPYASSMAFLSVGLFSFFIWIRLRDDNIYLLFFCISVASFLRTLHYHVGEKKLLMTDEWFSWLTINSIYWMVLITHFFLSHLHQRALTSLDRSAMTITFSFALISMPGIVDNVDAYTMAPLSYSILLLMGLTLGTFNALQSYHARSPNGMLLSVWAIIGIVFGIYDLLLQINFIQAESIYLGPYNNIGAFLIFMYITYNRYLGAHETVRLVNSGLQKNLQEREDELKVSHQRLRKIEMRQILSDERQRIMQDMHDGMGSSLISALLVVEKGHIDANMVADVLKNCIDDLKLTIDSMEPIQADLLLLLATVRYRLGPRLEHAGVVLKWEVENVPELNWIDPKISLHILRILQEAFTNIIKHARASEIRINTAVTDGFVMIIIADNGIGFSVQADINRERKGLANQRRRATLIGGSISWVCDAGTQLTLRLPIINNGCTARDIHHSDSLGANTPAL